MGKAETARRVGVSISFFYRHRHGHYRKVRMRIAISAVRVLQECRKNGEVRNRRSIIHGAAARGREEKLVNELSKMDNYYNRHSDIHNEYSLKSHHKRRGKREAELTT